MAKQHPNCFRWKSSVTNPLTKERFIEAMKTADEYGKKLKEERQEELHKIILSVAVTYIFYIIIKNISIKNQIEIRFG